MAEQSTAVVRYREHARELRKIAKDMRDTPTRLALMSFADDFERLAESMEATLEQVPC
jgi:hypothetical protein